MKVILANCPACGGKYDGPIRGGILTCEYCGARFALDADELGSLGADDQGYEEETDGEEYYEDLPPYDEFTEEACSEFIRTVGDEDFQESDKLKATLGIDDYERVFIMHDDTLFKSGKNGFAITDYGFYCREMAEPETNYFKWGDFAEASKPIIDGSYIKMDGVSVAYYTGSDATREELKSLYRKLRKYAKKFDWTDVD